MKYLTTFELAERWKVAHRTLANWRCRGHGPRYYKKSATVVYAYPDVKEWERENLDFLKKREKVESLQVPGYNP